jgi:hypothetical protein
VKRTFLYRYLLGGTFLLYLLIIVAPFRDVTTPLRVVVLGALLLMTVATRRRGRGGRLYRPALVLVIALVIATVVAVVVGSTTVLTCVSQASTAVLVAASILILGQTIIAAGVVDGHTVRGVLCIYLWLGLLFSALHDFSGALITHYLNGTGPHPTQSDTLYFSLITLTTVGFGDISPAANLARAIAATEALVGQLYLVSVVAAVVSRFRPQRGRLAGPPGPDANSPDGGASADDNAGSG